MQRQVVQIVGGSADCHTTFARREIRYNSQQGLSPQKEYPLLTPVTYLAWVGGIYLFHGLREVVKYLVR